MWPAHRLHCHQCTGALGTDCGNPPTTTATACSIFRENDQCFIRRQNGTVTRGCVSEVPQCDNPDQCFRCVGNGCNNIIGNADNVPEFNFASKNTISVMLLTVVAALAVFKY